MPALKFNDSIKQKNEYNQQFNNIAPQINNLNESNQSGRLSSNRDGIKRLNIGKAIAI